MSDNPMLLILNRLDALDSKMDRFDTRLSDLGLTIGNLGLTIGNLDSKIDSVRGALMARMDRLQDAMDGIRDDVSTNFFRAEAVERSARGAREEARNVGEVTMALTDQVNAMQRTLMKLSQRVDAIEQRG